MPDTQIDTKLMLKVLRDELALQTRHCRLLEAQEQALLSCDRPRFAALQEEHARLLPALEAQDAARRAALTDETGRPLTLSLLRELVPARSLGRLEGGLRQTLEQVQALTRRNKLLIQNELKCLAFTLDLFVEAGRCADRGYGPAAGSGQGRLTGRLLLDRRA